MGSEAGGGNGQVDDIRKVELASFLGALTEWPVALQIVIVGPISLVSTILTTETCGRNLGPPKPRRVRRRGHARGAA